MATSLFIERKLMFKSTKPVARRICLTPTNSQHFDVTFAMERPEAQKVLVCGDFNDRSPASLHMTRRSQNSRWDGISRWNPGRYEIKFVVCRERNQGSHAERNVRDADSPLDSVAEVQT